MIPKIIHNTYKSHDLPEIYKNCQAQIKTLHPEFDYRFYTDTDMFNIMRNEFPTYYDNFQALPRMIMKIDMFRYFLMYKYGGLYTDMDYLMLRRFDLLNHDVVIPCNREDISGNPTSLGNCIFASKPAHPFWKTLMDTLFTIDRTQINFNVDSTVDKNSEGTGPTFVFTMWQLYKEKDSIYIPKRISFHPLTLLNQTYVDKLKSDGIYGMHICTGLWRDNML
jgi:mannosyltransferase OCH1-like enzyme